MAAFVVCFRPLAMHWQVAITPAGLRVKCWHPFAAHRDSPGCVANRAKTATNMANLGHLKSQKA